MNKCKVIAYSDVSYYNNYILPQPHAHAHAHAPACTSTRTHTHTNTQTHKYAYQNKATSHRYQGSNCNTVYDYTYISVVKNTHYYSNNPTTHHTGYDYTNCSMSAAGLSFFLAKYKH